MSATLVLTALAMGLVGSPHCAVMCGAACAGLTGTGQARSVKPDSPGAGAASTVSAIPAPAGAGAMARSALVGSVIILREVVTDRRSLAFHAGRIVGYSAAGAGVALAGQGLAWLSAQGGGLRPLWTMFHLLVLAWGLSLLVLARQPDWAQRAGLQLWARVGPYVRRNSGLFVAGVLWVFMPCGLLWSALLVASLTASPWEGALAMLAFAKASSIGLFLVPGLMARLRSVQGRGQDWGTRLSGALLMATAVAALGMDLGQQILDYCF